MYILLNFIRIACKRKKCKYAFRKDSVQQVCTEDKHICGDCKKCKAFYGKANLCVLYLHFFEISFYFSP